jgi:excinuclease ABC subunit C
VRRRGGLRGSLDQIPGVGPKRHKSLLRHFGSVERVKGATVDDLAEVEGIGRGLAENIVRTLKHSASPRPR